MVDRLGLGVAALHLIEVGKRKGRARLVGSSRGVRDRQLVALRLPDEVPGLQADIGDAQTVAVTQVALDREIGLQRVWVVPGDVDRGIEAAAAVGGREVAAAEAVRARRGDIGKHDGGAGPVGVHIDVVEGLLTCLQRAGERIKDRAGGGDVVVACPTADHRLVVAEGTIGEAKARLEAQLGRGAQAGGNAGRHVVDDRGAGCAVLHAARGVRVGDTGRRAGVEVGELLRIQAVGMACRIDQLPGSGDRGIEVADVAPGIGERRVQLIAQAEGEVQIRSGLPVVLAVEGVSRRRALVVGVHVVELRLVRHTQEEVGELLAGRGRD